MSVKKKTHKRWHWKQQYYVGNPPRWVTFKEVKARKRKW